MVSVGIDISKKWFDVCVRREGASKLSEWREENALGGFRSCLKRALRLAGGEPVRFCMESTGGYEIPLAEFLVRGGQAPSVVNPALAKHFARSRGRLNKTDRADARTIAEFDALHSPRSWHLCDPELLELAQLRRHRDRLSEDLRRLANQLEHRSLRGEFEVRQLLAHQKVCESLMSETEARIEELAMSRADVQKKLRALMGIQGIGPAFALAVLLELGDACQYESAQQYAAQAGLNPCRRESGSFRGRTSISKAGSKHVRAAGWMPADVARRANPRVKALCERLEARGLKPKQVRTAAMRKLVMQAYGALKALEQGREPMQAPFKGRFRFRLTESRARIRKDSFERPAKAKLGWRTAKALKEQRTVENAKT